MRQSFVLILRDDASLLFCGEADAFLETHAAIEAALDSDPYRPVRILLDFTDQAFEQVNLPAANPFDRRKILGRKLRTMFGACETTGVLRTGKRQYVLAGSRTANDKLATALALLARKGNTVAFVGLLPVEFARWLALDFTGVADGWVLATMQSAVLGFRQIVLRDGWAIFTRSMPYLYSPPALEREIATTLAYLPRLGQARDAKVALVDLTDDNDDHTIPFARWISQQRKPALPIERKGMRLERFSRVCLRGAFVASATLALAGSAWLVHQHRQASAMAGEIVRLAAMEQDLAIAAAATDAPDSAPSQMRSVLAVDDALEQPEFLMQTKQAIQAALGLDASPAQLTYRRDPASVLVALNGGDLTAFQNRLKPLLPNRTIAKTDDGGIEIR